MNDSGKKVGAVAKLPAQFLQQPRLKVLRKRERRYSAPGIIVTSFTGNGNHFDFHKGPFGQS